MLSSVATGISARMAAHEVAALNTPSAGQHEKIWLETQLQYT